VHLSIILDDTKHKIDLTEELALLFSNPKYDLFSHDVKNVLQQDKVVSALEEAGWYAKPGSGKLIDNFHGTSKKEDFAGIHEMLIYRPGENPPNI
jgi:hypothetical protein